MPPRDLPRESPAPLASLTRHGWGPRRPRRDPASYATRICLTQRDGEWRRARRLSVTPRGAGSGGLAVELARQRGRRVRVRRRSPSADRDSARRRIRTPVQRVRIAREERPAPEALQIRMRHDGRHDPAAHAPAPLRGQHEHVADVGKGRAIGDDPREADLTARRRTPRSTASAGPLARRPRAGSPPPSTSRRETRGPCRDRAAPASVPISTSLPRPCRPPRP